MANDHHDRDHVQNVEVSHLRRLNACGGCRDDGQQVNIVKNSKDRVAPETAGKPAAFLAVFLLGLITEGCNLWGITKI